MFTDLEGGERGSKENGREGVWYGGGGKARRGGRKSVMGGRDDRKWVVVMAEQGEECT